MPGGRGGNEDGIPDLAFDPKLAVPKKRSLTIAGHRTSITLEDAFWHELRAVAEGSGVSVTALAAAINSMRGTASLSAAIRVFLLTRLRELPSNASE